MVAVAEALRQACELEPGASLPLADGLRRRTVADVFGRPAADPEVVRVSNGLIALMGYEPSREVDPTSVREEGVRSLIAFIEASCRRQPVVIELSDLHWADTMVLDLIDTIFDRLQRHPVVLLATSRPSLLDQLDAHGRAASTSCACISIRWTRRHQPSCSPRSSGSLPRPTLRGRSSSAVAATRSSSRSSLLCSARSPLSRPSATRRPGRRTGQMTDLPDTLREMRPPRLDALYSDERAVVQDAAVLGRREPVKALQEMANALGRDIDVDPAVAGLVDKEILVIDERDMWSFKSDLVREVAYNTITKYDRARNVTLASPTGSRRTCRPMEACRT